MLGALRGTALVAATLATGLMAGLFYAFAVSVMPGFARADDRTLIDGMQQINIAILNPWFMLSFLGAPALTVLAAVFQFRTEGRALLPWLAAAFALSLAVIVITRAVNIPLNDALEAAGRPDRIANLAEVKERFEATWVRWNIVRAVVGTASLGCLIRALMLYGRT